MRSWICYIARKDVLTEDSLDARDNALGKFHHYRKIFQECGVRPTGFSLPHQHSLIHYHHHIEKFRAPNRVSASITKSKHIAAVKKPWHQSSRYEALKQILTINTRNDKLAAARINFSFHGMLNGTCLSEALRTTGYSSDQHDGDASDNQTSVSPSGREPGVNSDDNNREGRGSDADEGEGQTGSTDEGFVLSEVILAQKRGRYFHICSHLIYSLKG